MFSMKQPKPRNFKPSWTIDYGFVKHGDKSRCALCSEIIVTRTSSVKRHFETNHKDIAYKDDDERKKIIFQRLKGMLQNTTPSKIQKTDDGFHLQHSETKPKTTEIYNEYEAKSFNIVSQLKRMNPTQQIYAELLIQKVLTNGLLGKLSETTDILDCAASHD